MNSNQVKLITDLFPTKANRTTNTCFSPEQVRKDAANTRVIVHKRYPALVQEFLAHKRQYGSTTEKALYRTADSWTWRDQVARLIEKRPLVFMGPEDFTVLREGECVDCLAEEWDRVGTEEESVNRYLKLASYLSYDEIMLSSLLGVSGPSYFINDGNRGNSAKPGRQGTFEPRGIIMGLVGARFERPGRMDSIFVQKEGQEWRQDERLTKIFTDFFGQPRRPDCSFDDKMYKARMRITAETMLWEANDRAQTIGKKAHVHVVGLGLGVWKIASQQPELYVETFEDAIRHLGSDLRFIGVIEFSSISVSEHIQAQIVNSAASSGIQARFSNRNPAARLPDDESLLVISYAWDGNAFPGNEYWAGSLSASGDPAAACMSTIAELHNPLLNPDYLQRICVLGG